jgi:dUTP pyrophosphatase
MKISLDADAKMPERAHETDAGLDLFANEAGWVAPGCAAIFNTGVHIEIPRGHVGLLTSKSGLMKKDITSRGTIDCGYTGSIKAVLFNHGSRGYHVNKGDKITQLVLLPMITPELELVDALEGTERGEAGFGSTGR